jgi:hypothetical protein
MFVLFSQLRFAITALRSRANHLPGFQLFYELSFCFQLMPWFLMPLPLAVLGVYTCYGVVLVVRFTSCFGFPNGEAECLVQRHHH